MRQFSHAIEDIPINSLKPYPRNARFHSKAQIKQIAAYNTKSNRGDQNPELLGVVSQ
jgi:hypothetical protein